LFPREETCVDQFVFYGAALHRKYRASKPPVRHKNHILNFFCRGREVISQKTGRDNVESHAAKITVQEAIRFFKRDGAAALWTGMFYLQGLALQPFAALIAKNRFVKVFIVAMPAGFDMCDRLHLVAAFRAEQGIRREIFSAVLTLLEHHNLMAAHRTEFCVGGKPVIAVRALWAIMRWMRGVGRIR